MNLFNWFRSLFSKTEELPYFNLAFEHASEAIAITLKGYILHANPSYEKLLGYSHQELVGMHALAFVPEQYVVIFEEIMKNGLKDKPFELELLRKDKSLVWVEVIQKEVRHKGELYRVSCVRDISELKNEAKDRDTLQQISEVLLGAKKIEDIYQILPNLLSKFLEYPMVSIDFCDFSARKIYRTASKNLPENQSWKFGEHFSERVAVHGDPLWVRNIEKEIQENPEDIGLQEYKKLGVVSFVSVPMKTQDKILGTLTLAHTQLQKRLQNVSETLQVVANILSETIEAKTAQSERDKFFSISVDILAIMDLEGRFRRVNPAFEILMGIKKSEVSKFRLSDIVSEKDLEKCTNMIGRLHRGEPVVDVELNCISKIHNMRCLSWSAMSVSGEHIIYLVARDLTEKKKSESLLKEQEQKMVWASKMSSLGEMAGGIAHEINNPLAIIHGKAGLLKDLLEDESVSRDQLKVVTEGLEDTVLRISKIIRGLRSFARDGEDDPFYPTFLKQIISDCLEFGRERFKAAGIDLIIGEIPENLEISCRSTQIVQVLINLLNNAYQAIDKNEKKWIKIEVEDHGESVVIAVVDSGDGIPPEIREKIMQPFFTTKEIGKGTGLGLSISKGIVESHKGEFFLDVKSKNTRFCLKLQKRPNLMLVDSDGDSNNQAA